jgi:hypothetical protein
MDAQSIFGNLYYNKLMALYASSSLAKIPLRVKVKEEIGRVGAMGRPTGMTFHFPFLSLFSSPILFFLIFN